MGTATSRSVAGDGLSSTSWLWHTRVTVPPARPTSTTNDGHRPGSRGQPVIAGRRSVATATTVSTAPTLALPSGAEGHVAALAGAVHDVRPEVRHSALSQGVRSRVHRAGWESVPDRRPTFGPPSERVMVATRRSGQVERGLPRQEGAHSDCDYTSSAAPSFSFRRDVAGVGGWHRRCLRRL
jgi:hypothetical protein